MKELQAVGEKLGVTVDCKTAGALAISLQAMRDACKDEATSQVRDGKACAGWQHWRFRLFVLSVSTHCRVLIT